MKKREMLVRALPWLVLVAAYMLSMAFIGLYGAHNINADDASEMILAQELNREGALLSQQWLYSTELRLLSPVPLYQLGLILFPGSWHAARTFAIAVVILGVAASFLFMARQFGLKESAPWLAAVLVLPFSATYAYVIVYRCYYAVHLMCAFIMLGLISRIGRAQSVRWGAAALLVVLGFLSGLNGVRLLTMIVAPLAGASILLAACACKEHETFREAKHEPAVRMCLASMAMLAAAGIGYLGNLLVLRKLYSFMDYTDSQVYTFEFSDLLHQLSNLVRDLGYRTNVPLFSMKGVGSWVSLLIFMMIALALWRLFSRWNQLRPEHRLLALTAVLAVLLGMLLNVLLQMYITRYFIVGTILMIVLIGLAIETEPCKNGALRKIAILFVAACFAFQANCTMRYDYSQGEVNYEMAADWLLEHGYTQGYATFWHANQLTEASNGQIEMWVLADVWNGVWQNMDLQTTLQMKEHLEQAPEGRFFMLVDEEQNKEDMLLIDEDHLVGDLVAWSYYIYGYESMDEVRAMSEAAEAAN